MSLGKEETRQKGVQAIADDYPPRVQASDLRGFESETVQRYDSKVIPQKFLLNPSGLIAASSLRGSALLMVLATFSK